MSGNEKEIDISAMMDKNENNRLKTIKIAISDDTYRKIKSFGVLVGFEDKEPVLFGNAITKLYDLSKDKIYKEFV